VKIHLSVAYWPWYSFEEQVALAQAADRAGLEGVWVSEAWGQDVVSILAILADRTERIGIGSALMQIPARQPTAAAMAAATIDVISGGRMRLGLGVSGPQVSEGWYGVPFERQLGRIREYVEIVRMAWARQPVIHEGRNFQIPTEEGMGLGKPLKLMAKPVQERLPIYVGAIGPKSVELVGEIADGWIPAFYDPDDGAGLLGALERGLAKAGRDRSEIDVAPTVPVAVEDDVEEARNALRPIISFYLGGMGARDKNFYVDLLAANGLADEAHEVQDKFLSGDRIGAAMALTPEVIDMCGVACTPGELGERLGRFEAAGANSVIAIPFGSDKQRVVEQLAAVQDAAG
jgi:F420-dependent oxidoreductase-like protein